MSTTMTNFRHPPTGTISRSAAIPNPMMPRAVQMMRVHLSAWSIFVLKASI